MDVFGAAGSGDLERVRAVVEQDAGLVHATDDDGATPVMHAAENGHLEVARHLIDHGATINHHDNFRWTALHLACLWGHTRVVLLLLQRGADATAVDSDGATPLTIAASEGRDAVVRMLLEHGGSDVDAADDDGCTASHWACGQGHSGMLRQLLEAGAEPTLRDAHAHTASDLAAEGGEQECVTILQEWERAYSLLRVRRTRDASSATAPAASPGL